VGQFKLFSLDAGGGVDLELTHSDNVEVEHPMGRWERWYTEKWVDALATALTQPVRFFGPDSRAVYEIQHAGDQVVLERLLRLMQISRRHNERFDAAELDGAAPEDVEELYRELGHDWKAPAEELTNWEVCLLMVELSMVGPMGREGYEEYKRAFAHCFGLATYRTIFREEPLDVDECRMARWKEPSKHRLPPLDEEERAWIARFNAALKEPSLAEEFFRAEVVVK